jgi:single-strand DNA-binding protein
MNKVILIGRLTKDPELRYTASGVARTTFTLAVNRPVAQGEQQADFIPVIVWRKAAENTAQYMKKGSLVAVEGRIEVRKFQDNDGTNRAFTAVVANRVQFLEPKRDNGGQPESQTDSFGDPFDISDDDLPF